MKQLIKEDIINIVNQLNDEFKTSIISCHLNDLIKNEGDLKIDTIENSIFVNSQIAKKCSKLIDEITTIHNNKIDLYLNYNQLHILLTFIYGFVGVLDILNNYITETSIDIYDIIICYDIAHYLEMDKAIFSIIYTIEKILTTYDFTNEYLIKFMENITCDSRIKIFNNLKSILKLKIYKSMISSYNSFPLLNDKTPLPILKIIYEIQNDILTSGNAINFNENIKIKYQKEYNRSELANFIDVEFVIDVQHTSNIPDDEVDIIDIITYVKKY